MDPMTRVREAVSSAVEFKSAMLALEACLPKEDARTELADAIHHRAQGDHAKRVRWATIAGEWLKGGQSLAAVVAALRGDYSALLEG